MNKPAAPRRIYCVEDKVNEVKYLVRAANKIQAVNHVVGNQFDAALPSQDELLELVSDGIKVEDAAIPATSDEPVAA